MKHANKQLALLACLAGTCWLAARAAPATAEPKEDELLKLSPFVVSGSASSVGRYASFESTSAGRIRTDIMDSSQNISVITAELLQDVAPGRIVEAAAYVAGITDSSLPTSWDRTNLRGFLAEGRTIDGFTFGAYPLYGTMNLDPAIIDRIEVVKGPSSILAPQPTSPGGTINSATKQPQFRDFGLINLRWGQFGANSGSIDINRTVNEKFAVRVVGSRRDYEHWWEGAFVKSTTVMPEFTYRFSPSTQLTVQYIYADWNASNYYGLPLDPTSGTTTKAQLLAGVPRDLNVYADDIVRTDQQHDLKLLFTAEIGHGVQMRLAGVYHEVSSTIMQMFTGPSESTGPNTGGDGGNFDPLTGLWNYGLQYQQTPPYAPSPLTKLPTRTFTRFGRDISYSACQWQVQNDFVFIHESDVFKSTTLAGFAYSEAPDYEIIEYNLSAPAFAIDAYVDTLSTRGTLFSHSRYSNRFGQAYVVENLALLKNRLILNLSHSWQEYDRRTLIIRTGASARNSPRTSLPSGGIVIKPCKDAVSLYYSYTEQSSALSPATGQPVPSLSTSEQNEFGARFKVWTGKLYLAVAHFDLTQDNFTVVTPPVPPGNPPRQPRYMDRTAEGWEFELRAHPTKNISVIGSYTHFRNRDQNGLELRTAAEKSGSLLASFAFDKECIPALAGFRVAVGVNYLGERPGDTPNSIFTVASTATTPIPNQASFYLGARTLVNLTLAYDSRNHWGIQVNVDNLLDKEYLMAANIRNGVFPGPPRNIRVSLQRSF